MQVRKRSHKNIKIAKSWNTKIGKNGQLSTAKIDRDINFKLFVQALKKLNSGINF
jgi:hypothetical protein